MLVPIVIADFDANDHGPTIKELGNAGFPIRILEDPSSIGSALRRPALVLVGQLGPLERVEYCRRIRSTSDVPLVVFEDGRSEAALLLDAGADTVLSDRASPLENVARVRAVARRCRWSRPESFEPAPDGAVSCGGCVLDPSARTVATPEGMVRLTPSETELLQGLMKGAGVVQRREVLIRLLNGGPRNRQSKLLDVHIRRLRHKIEPDPSAPTRIVTIRGVGFRFEIDGGDR